MTDEKKLTNELTDELLNEEQLDNVAGGAIEIVRRSGYVKKIERTPRGCGQIILTKEEWKQKE